MNDAQRERLDALRTLAVAHGCGWGRRGHWWHFHDPRQYRGFGRPGDHGPDERSDFELGEEEGGDEIMGGRQHGRGMEGWGFGWGFDWGRGYGRTDRPLEQGDLRWLTLDLIAAQPRHGYEIIKAIADELHGHYTPSPGAVYPVLTLLEETGLIAGETRGSKKLYSLTDEGRAEVAAHAGDIRAAKARLSQAAARFGGRPAPELARALGNLRAALQVRLAKGPLSAEAINAITAALDRAAAEIERS